MLGFGLLGLLLYRYLCQKWRGDSRFAQRLTAAVLAALPKGCLIVDLASKPGGTDFAAARRLGHTALHALSLPTVWAPETAGEALARTVQTILQEREGTI